MNLENILEWYQQRIGQYDKKSWETTVEQRILRGLSYSSTKTAKQKSDLIDVDLVRGSTFPKAKPQLDVWLAGIQGVIRIIFLPLFFRWWLKEVSFAGLVLVFAAYCSVFISSLMYYALYEDEVIKIIPVSEVALPAALLVLLSFIVSQMACTRNKGIAFAFREKRAERPARTPVKKDQKLRGSKKVVAKVEGYGGPIGYSEKHNSQPNKTAKQNMDESLDAVDKFRPQSEDSHFCQSIHFGKRSMSESDLTLVRPSPHKECYKTKNGSSNYSVHPSSGLRNSSSKDDITNSTPDNEECSLRYRGCGRRRSHRDKVKGLARSLFKRDIDDDCHADCESPASDEEDTRGGQKSSNRFGSFFYSLKPDPSVLTPRHCYKKVPRPTTSDDPSNSSCDSDAEKRGYLPRFHLASPESYFSSDCIGITSNSEEANYSSDSDGGWDDLEDTTQTLLRREPIDWHIQGSPAAIISSTTKDVDKIGCKIWQESEMKKVELSVLDISSAIISRVNSLHQSSNYCLFGLLMGLVLCFVPSMYRLGVALGDNESSQDGSPVRYGSHCYCFWLLQQMFGNNLWCFFLIVLCGLNRLVLGSCFFFVLSVAERIFKQRFLCAKQFSYLTSARRARKYDLPHFRLSKVLNIKSWLSIRSCLKKRGPQHSVDVIISATFILTLILVFYLGVEAIKDEDKTTQPLYNVELFIWCFALSIYLIRFMTLGSQINKKYSNPSVLITEQINMYFQMEKNPHKKENLMLANNVLKLVSVLLKELDCPFKISGLSANTLLYNITKFGILSACSGVLSNLLGFKLKLYNLKFR